MVVLGSYLMTSCHIRIKDDDDPRPRFIPSDRTHRETLTLDRLKDRCEHVFQMAPEKMKKLVIVNSTLSSFAMIQACVEVAEKYADEVMVIPQMLGVLTYASGSVAKNWDPRANEALLVVIITSKFIDYVVLRRDQNFVLSVAECRHYEPWQYKEIFPRFVGYEYPNANILLVEEQMRHIAGEIESTFAPDHCIIKTFDDWNFLLSAGALYLVDDVRFDPRYRIANFSSGYYAKVYNPRTQTEEEQVLLPERSPLPCNISGINGHPQSIQLCYFPEYYEVDKKLILTKHKAISNEINASGSSAQILGYVDERGVPYAHPSRNYGHHCYLIRSENQFLAADVADGGAVTEHEKNEQLGTETAVASNQGIFTESSSVAANAFDLKFLFLHQCYAIEAYQNGVAKLLVGPCGNDWTPLYLSMADNRPKVGEEAKKDYEKFPERVIYDILKIIGKQMNEIETDPKWGFKLIENTGIASFHVETPSGPRLVPVEIALAAFMKAMKLQAQSVLGDVQEIRVSTRFALSESQKLVFENAAAKVYAHYSKTSPYISATTMRRSRSSTPT